MTAVCPERSDGGHPHHHVTIVGSGFAGLGAAINLLRQGIRDFVVLERAGDVGGTWRDNTYPGCQCDVPSHLYSFSFAPNPEWTRTYSEQAEIAAYLRRTAEHHGVMPYIRFDTPLLDARWLDGEQCWQITTPDGIETADVLVMANGPLSEPKVPDVLGVEGFAGTTFHSADWNHEHDLTGERVAVVGTGASAIQFVPRIHGTAGHITIFQRTPPWVLPHPDRPIRDWERRLYRRAPIIQRAVRSLVYVAREWLMVSFAKRPQLMGAVAAGGRRHLERHVPDPALRAKLTPNYTPGCKRLLLSNDWYSTLSQPDVEVVTAGVRAVREHSVLDTDGVEHEVDTIIFATGFHVTDNPVMELVHGRDGRSIAEVWRHGGMRAYRGTTVAGFPNLFFLAGPNTGIGHTSLVVMIEAQIRYLIDALRSIDTGLVVDVRPEAMERFNMAVQRAMAPTVWNIGGCASWYQDDLGRNPTIWPDFTFRFMKLTRRFDAGDYRLERRRDPVRLVAAEP
jgi:cation diffusion facilitator CzcD-associated flavoprotein CzcO